MSQDSNAISGIQEFFDRITKHPDVFTRHTSETIFRIYNDVLFGLEKDVNPAVYTLGWLVTMQGVEDSVTLSLKLPRTDWQFWVAFNSVANHLPALQARVDYQLLRQVVTEEFEVALRIAVAQGLHRNSRNLLQALHFYVKPAKEKRFMGGDFMRLFNGMYRMVDPEHKVNHPAFRNIGSGAYKFTAEFIQQYYTHLQQKETQTEAIALSLETLGKDAITFESEMSERVAKVMSVVEYFIHTPSNLRWTPNGAFKQYCANYGIDHSWEDFNHTYNQVRSGNVAQAVYYEDDMPFWMGVCVILMLDKINRPLQETFCAQHDRINTAIILTYGRATHDGTSGQQGFINMLKTLNTYLYA